MGTLCLSNYHMHIIYHLDEANEEYVRRIVLIRFLFLTKYQPVKSPRSEYDGLWKASSHISLIQQVQENWFQNHYAGNRVHVTIYKISRCFCAMLLFFWQLFCAILIFFWQLFLEHLRGWFNKKNKIKARREMLLFRICPFVW